MVSPKLAASLNGDPTSLKAIPLLRDDRWDGWFDVAGASPSGISFSALEMTTQDSDAIAAKVGNSAALLSPRLFERELRYGTLVAPFPHVIKGQSRSDERTSEHQSLMRISYAVFLLKKI